MRDVPESLDSDALAKRLGISARTLRAWVAAGAVPRPPARGHNTRFDRAAIIVAHAVAALRREGVRLPQTKQLLAGKTEAELRELGGLPPAPAPRSPRALPANASPSAEPPTKSGPLSGDVMPSSPIPRPNPLDAREEVRSGAPVGSEWRRIELLPGLELHVRSDAPPFVHGVAAAIAAGRFTK